MKIIALFDRINIRKIATLDIRSRVIFGSFCLEEGKMHLTYCKITSNNYNLFIKF